MAYDRHNWAVAEKITASLLNNIEDGIVEAHTKIDNIEQSGTSGSAIDTTHFPETGKLISGTGSATSDYAVALGQGATASAVAAFAEGKNTTASGLASHAEGEGTTAASAAQHVSGKYNVVDRDSTYVEIIGNGASSSELSNARTLDWNGNESIAGDLTINAGSANQLSVSEIIPTLSTSIQAKADVSALESLAGSAIIKPIIHGYIVLSNEIINATTPVSSEDYVYSVTECVEGTKFTINAAGTYETGTFAIIDAEGNRLVYDNNLDENATDPTVRTGRVITAPETSAYLIVNQLASNPVPTYISFETMLFSGSNESGEHFGENGSFSVGTGEATGSNAFASGSSTTASGASAHAEGSSTTASGAGSHAEGGSTVASGAYSHAEGDHTLAQSASQHVVGKYNIGDQANTYVEIVGNGTNETRSNARTLDWSGNEILAGTLTIGGTETITAQQLAAIKRFSIADGGSGLIITI